MARVGAVVKTIENSVIFNRMAKLLRFLYEEGPHTSAQLGDEFETSMRRIAELLNLLASEGQVEQYRVRGVIYWKVCDHVELEMAD